MKELEDCQERGDVYLFCEGECRDRCNGEALCSAHWGVWNLRLALGTA